MNDLSWTELRINEYYRYEYNPIDNVWRTFEDEDVSDEVSALLSYIQAIDLPKQSNESLKFMIDGLKVMLEYKNVEIEKLREETGFYK
jgi:hypothetical protein